MTSLTFEQELLRAPQYREHTETQTPEEKPSFAELLGILNYNQGLVEFADSKAGSLILLNSLLIAAIGALPSTGEIGTFKLASVLLCSAAVYVCFQVISSKESSTDNGPGGMTRRKTKEWERNDYLFFGCISKHKSGGDFSQSFRASKADDRREAMLQRAYIIAGIAQRKFGQYKVAQQITSVALAVWVLVNLVPFV